MRCSSPRRAAAYRLARQSRPDGRGARLPSRPRRLHVLGLPGRRLAEGPRHPHRPHPASPQAADRLRRRPASTSSPAAGRSPPITYRCGSSWTPTEKGLEKSERFEVSDLLDDLEFTCACSSRPSTRAFLFLCLFQFRSLAVCVGRKSLHLRFHICSRDCRWPVFAVEQIEQAHRFLPWFGGPP